MIQEDPSRIQAHMTEGAETLTTGISHPSITKEVPRFPCNRSRTRDYPHSRRSVLQLSILHLSQMLTTHLAPMLHLDIRLHMRHLDRCRQVETRTSLTTRPRIRTHINRLKASPTKSNTHARIVLPLYTSRR